MKPEEIKNQETIWVNQKVIWLILQKIRELLIKSTSRIVIYTISLENIDEKFVNEEIERLYELQSFGAIKILMRPSPTICSYKKTNKKRVIEKSEKKVYFIPLEVLKPKFEEVYQFYKEKSIEETSMSQSRRNCLKSIHLVTTSLEPQDVIFLVLDEQYMIPIRFAVKNKNGHPTYIKKLYDIAYIVNVPGKKVDYDKRVADCINNGLFRREQVKKYMRTNRLEKPTLVQKSKDNTLVLKNEIPVQTILVKNIPFQYQSLYICKL